ncbi:MAG: transposase, partial [Bacillota bacterium]|nr:transposase [Bacillota bacterium]
KYLKVQTNKGREEYNPFKMIKIVLFAFMNQIYTLRGIEKACKTDIRFMYLMGEEKPSHMAIQRFITKYLKDSIENVFKDIFISGKNDQKTLISFMNEFKELYKRRPKVVVADAGYGSYDTFNNTQIRAFLIINTCKLQIFHITNNLTKKEAETS